MIDPEINFIEKKKLDLKGFTLIEGFPGMGLVGTISAKYIAEKLGFDEIGYIESDIFVPILRVHEGLPVYPSRIYVHEKNKLVILISEQVIPQIYTPKFAISVVEWIEKKEIGRVISLAGIRAQADAKQKAGIIYGIASNNESKDILKKYGVEIIKEGITTGINALILLELEKKNIEAFSLLSNVEVAADYKGAAELVKKIDEIAGLQLDVKPLLKEAKETEQLLLENMKELKKIDGNVKKFEDSVPMYT